MKRFGRILAGVLAVVVAVGILNAFQPTTPAVAANAVDFDPGYIISDEKFFNGGAMDAAAVQSFLNSKVSSCTSGYTCLKSYRQDTWTRAADSMCTSYAGAAQETAAQIIAKVGSACNINPQVLLVLLEKEQSLVTSSSPSATRYEKATGYACPDTAPCDAEYAGFYNQVYKAAWQYKRYSNPVGTAKTYTWIPVGRTSNIQYHPNASCGSSPVLIRNQATAGLYYYTPYQPNATAMSNVYGGQNDGCSSYGNRNFWRLFTDWFGPTTSKVDPSGVLESVTGSNYQISVTGWALDPDTTDPLAIHVYVDGVGTAVTTANLSRPEISDSYNRTTPVGFSTTLAAGVGSHNVCVWAINVGAGGNTMIGCRSVDVVSAPPIGQLTSVVASPGAIDLAGWALDPDTTGPIQVHAYVDGQGTPFTANGPSPVSDAQYPSSGTNHGFSQRVAASVGDHNVCLYAINSGAGPNPIIECRIVTVSADNPFGDFISVTGGSRSITVSAWAIDPNTTSAIQIHYYIGSAGTPTVANQASPAIDARFPGRGTSHASTTTLAAAVGSQQVCAWAINTGAGSNVLLGCRTVTVIDSSPIGAITSASAVPGGIDVSGWGLDPDTTSAIQVHLYVGSRGVPLLANGASANSDALYPQFGTNHGYSGFIHTGPGAQTVCAYGINVGTGANTQLACRTVTVSDSPLGEFGIITAPGAVKVSGWAADPNSTSPIAVHVYIDAAGTPLTANGSSAVSDARYPLYGTGHGYASTLRTTPGTHNVCAYAINTGAGSNTQIGCQTVTVPDTSPFGAVTITTSPGAVSVSGWAIDPDTTSAIQVHTYIGGSGTAVVASGASASTDAQYPDYGTNHGFARTISTASGTANVCVYAINVSGGSNTVLACQTVTVPDASPVGEFTSATGKIGGIEVTGRATDPDGSGPIQVHLYIGSRGTPVNANGANGAFATTVPSESGSQSICAYAINVGSGSNTLLGCKTVTVLDSSPVGELTTAVGRTGAVEVTGRATDPDGTPIQVHIYAGGRGTPLSASGTDGAFSSTVVADAGTQSVCAYAINVGPGSNTLLGCKTVTVADASPVVQVFNISARPDGFYVDGTISDPDATGPSQVHVYVDGRGTPVNATSSGSFAAESGTPPGTHNVCVYGINQGAGSNTAVPCQTVTISPVSPFGALYIDQVSAGSVTVSGWAVDPETQSPIQVHVYAGSAGTPLLASGASAASDARYPVYGTSHGYSLTISRSSGPVTICAYAINVGSGSNTTLACRVVTVP